jgi:thymidylate kinase
LRRRAASGKQDRIDLENVGFHEQARNSYLTVAKANDRGRWVIVDANKSIEEVADELWRVVTDRLEV